MHKLDVLTRVDEHGYPFFLNKQIGATRWVPKNYPHDEVLNAIVDLVADISNKRTPK